MYNLYGYIYRENAYIIRINNTQVTILSIQFVSATDEAT